MTTPIKICGLTNLEDARVAAHAGADYLGFIFHRKSPRYVEADTVREILAALRAEGLDTPGVGVFVNYPAEQVRTILAKTGLRYAQLHGDEPPQDLQTLAPWAYKALRPQADPGDPHHAAALQQASVYIAQTGDSGPDLLVDAYDPAAYGGTGHLADHDLAAALARQTPHLLLAGGLTPDNVTAAIHSVRPWGVDVSSGVERTPGHKDHHAVQAFIHAARRAAQ